MVLGEVIRLKGRKPAGLKLHLQSKRHISALIIYLFEEASGTEAEGDYKKAFHHHRNPRLKLHSRCVSKHAPCSKSELTSKSLSYPE